MSVFNKKETCVISNKALIFNTQTILEFLFKFQKTFNLEIIAFDSSSEERTFKAHYLYYKDGIQKDSIIEINDYEANLKFMIETKGLDEDNFKNEHKNQIEFIKKFL